MTILKTGSVKQMSGKLRVGSLVRYHHAGETYRHGVVTSIDDCHRQTVAHVLFSSGIEGPIWENHLELVNEA